MNAILEQDVEQFALRFALKDELRGKTVAVTGATGLLGACMVRCLLALNRQQGLGLRVLAVVRNTAKAEAMFGKQDVALGFYAYDFSANEAFQPTEKIDFIVHFASPTTSKYFVEYPVETMVTVFNGTKNLLDYARTSRTQSVLLASSLEVYGTITDDSTPLTEEAQGYLDPMAVRSSYPMAKRAAETLCHDYAKEYGTHTKVARLAQTFGAGVAQDDTRVFAQFARSIIKGENIVMHTKGELCRSYCYTTDAIAAMLYILLRGKDGEAYNVANETTYISIKDMASFLAETFNPRVKVVVELKENMGYSPTTKLRLSTDKVRQLGWTPQYDLQKMFHRLIESLKQ